MKTEGSVESSSNIQTFNVTGHAARSESDVTSHTSTKRNLDKFSRKKCNLLRYLLYNLTAK